LIIQSRGPVDNGEETFAVVDGIVIIANCFTAWCWYIVFVLLTLVDARAIMGHDLTSSLGNSRDGLGSPAILSLHDLS
jgi:hypothetical protein